MSSKAILRDLVRASVEFDAAALFRDHLRAIGSEWVRPNFELCTIAGALCEYAQTGNLSVPGVPHPDPIVLAIRLTEALFYPAIETLPVIDEWWWTRIHGTSSMALVLRGAVARFRLSSPVQSVPTAFLASLASVSPGRVRQLVSTQVLAASRVRHGDKVYTMVDGHSARSWLSAHGIPNLLDTSLESA